MRRSDVDLYQLIVSHMPPRWQDVSQMHPRCPRDVQMPARGHLHDASSNDASSMMPHDVFLKTAVGVGVKHKGGEIIQNRKTNKHKDINSHKTCCNSKYFIWDWSETRNK